jgi:protein DPCD
MLVTSQAGVSMDAEAASMAHANNTLIISYTKPKEILVFEGILKGERDKMKAEGDGDVDCTTQ